MFVLEALLLTFITTPLVTALYPPHRRVRVAATGTDVTSITGMVETHPKSKPDDEDYSWKTRFTVVLDKIEHLPGMMALTQLVLPVSPIDSDSTNTGALSGKIGSTSRPHAKQKSMEPFVDALRLIELSDRTSAVMKSSVADTILHSDPLLGVFRMFGELHDLDIATSLSIVTYSDLAYSVADHARNNASQLILLPWLPPSISGHEPNATSAATPRAVGHTSNPFDAIFGSKVDKSASAIHSQFVRGVFAQSKTDVALFIDRSHTPGETRVVGSTQHIFLPFIGGPDDRLALEFVVQLCTNPRITATIMKIAKKEVDPAHKKLTAVHSDEVRVADEIEANIRGNEFTVTSVGSIYLCSSPTTYILFSKTIGLPDTVYGHATTQTRLQSETADSVTWARYTMRPQKAPLSPLTDALSRIEFTELATPAPLHAAVESATSQLDSLLEKRSRLLVVAGRSRRLAVESHQQELRELTEEHGSVGHEVKKTIGDVATAFVISGCKAGLVVVQAAVGID